MLSLKDDQNNYMNNINSLLSNRDKEINLIPRIKTYIGELSGIHSKMHETESFILQLTQKEIENIKEDNPKNNKNDNIT